MASTRLARRLSGLPSAVAPRATAGELKCQCHFYCPTGLWPSPGSTARSESIGSHPARARRLVRSGSGEHCPPAARRPGAAGPGQTGPVWQRPSCRLAVAAALSPPTRQPGRAAPREVSPARTSGGAMGSRPPPPRRCPPPSDLRPPPRPAPAPTAHAAWPQPRRIAARAPLHSIRPRPDPAPRPSLPSLHSPALPVHPSRACSPRGPRAGSPAARPAAPARPCPRAAPLRAWSGGGGGRVCLCNRAGGQRRHIYFFNIRAMIGPCGDGYRLTGVHGHTRASSCPCLSLLLDRHGATE